MTEEGKFENVFTTLSQKEIEFLIGMTHFSYPGEIEDAIVATTAFPKEEVKKMLTDLRQRGLIEQGKLDKTKPHTETMSIIKKKISITGSSFIPDPNGDHFRMPEDFKLAFSKHFRLPLP